MIDDRNELLKKLKNGYTTHHYGKTIEQINGELVECEEIGKEYEEIDEVLKKYGDDKEVIFELFKTLSKANLVDFGYEYDLWRALEKLSCFQDSKMCNDKEFMLNAVSICGGLLYFASDELKNDEEVVLAAINSPEGYYSIQYAGDEIKHRSSFAQKMIPIVLHPYPFGDVDGKSTAGLLEEIPELSKNKQMILDYLDYSGYNLHDDREGILYGIDKSLLNDPEFMFQVLERVGSDYIEEFLPKKLKNNPEFVLRVLKSNMDFDDIQYFLDSDEKSISENKEIVLESAKRFGYIEFASDELKNDEEIALAALSASTDALEEDISEELRENKDFVKKALEIIQRENKSPIGYLENSVYGLLDEYGGDLRKDKKLILQLLKKGIPDIVYCMDEELLNDSEVALEAIKTGERGVGWIGEQLKSNPEFMKQVEEIQKQRELERKQKEEQLQRIQKKLAETKTVVTHFGDDLDNKSSIYALERWAKGKGILKKDENLQVERVPAGRIKEGMLNVDTGGHTGNREDSNGTIVIDGNPANGVKSAAQSLDNLGIYVPRQIVELADTMPNKVSPLDSRSGLALVKYLSGEQTFELAEQRLLDKTLKNENLKDFKLIKVFKKQKEIIDKAVEKIEKYTKELPNGEKIVLSPEQIKAGSMIAYEKGIPYYASASDHFDKDKNPDGVTFAITSKPGTKLPEEILKYGRELVEQYRIDENTSGVFVNPNGQMIVAGGFKNPEFKIPNETKEGILGKIEAKFMGQDIEKEQEEQK